MAATKAEIMEKLNEAFSLLAESEFTLFSNCEQGDLFYIKPYRAVNGKMELKITEFADGEFYLQYFGDITLIESVKANQEIKDSQIKLYGKKED